MAQVLAEWGMAGIDALRSQVAVLVLVDVLSFSTAVDVAVSRRAQVLPFPLGDDPAAARLAAEHAGAVLALPRRAGGGQFSLSPASLLAIPAGTRLMLPSPNGSRLSLAGAGTPVLAGCLRNAAAVARAARGLAGDSAIGVVPAGERWPDGSLRPAIEDLLGAGAIIAALGLPCSPEAQVMRDACRMAGAELPRLIRESVSGRELVEGGFPHDVALALEREVSGTAPLLVDGAYRAG
ncbi:MAG: 2-phosphosulfolactate phosphatase [Inquilinus limosus]|uniref:Probable 2-phosphosulfolactate phosphatase n=1 Tax=Inquilinus limosus TaxID=171674 RepID=A0A952KNV6_9PROT|nr:2-phosphosulfolactate phosphatase [Inquilinus limosus]